MVEMQIGDLVAAIQKLSACAQAIKSGGREASDWRPLGLMYILTNAIAGAGMIIPIAHKLELDATEIAAQRLFDLVDPLREKHTRTGTLLYSEIPLAEIDDLATQVTIVANDQLSKRYALALSPRERELYEAKVPPFGADVAENFSSSNDDIEDASRALALGQSTACVLLLMRALEPALDALEENVEVVVQKKQWGNRIDQIEKAIEAMKNGHHTRTATKDETDWYSEAATHFRYIKDAWRNYAAHGKKRYDERQAQKIYENVRDFMWQLAMRLKEPSSLDGPQS